MYYDECLANYRELLGKPGVAYLLYHYGLVALQQGDLVHAEGSFAESLRLYQELEGHDKIILTLAGMAGAALARKLLERAACLFGAADTLRYDIGYHLDVDDSAELDATIAAARVQLDDPTFAAAWEAGRAMSLEQAVAYALEQLPSTDS
jgi:hypothetical protein